MANHRPENDSNPVPKYDIPSKPIYRVSIISIIIGSQ